jgi:hypothetical protein
MSKVTFKQLLDDCAFQVYERQNRLATLVGDHDWLLDTESATITFGEDLVFPVQFLGTQSEVTKTWLWADANRHVKFPAASLEFCRKVRTQGHSVGIDEFAADQFLFVAQVGKPTAHTLAKVAVSLGSGSAYHRCPHESGAVFVVINDPRIDAQPDLDREAFVEAFNDLMWEPGNMKRQIVSYLSKKGYINSDWDGTELNCCLKTGEEIGFTFRQTSDGGMEVSFAVERGKQ